MADEIALTGGRVTAGVVRVGDTVRRPIKDRAQVHSLLRHLEEFGLASTPRFLGIDDKGREVLSYLAGDVPSDLGHYDDPTLCAAAALLRQFHDATERFPAVIASGSEVMCHNDWGAHNAVFRDGRPIGIIDFDTLRPGLRLWDLGYSAISWLDLGNDDYTGDEQIRRIGIFCAGYGRPDYHASLLAAFCVARQTALSVAGRAKGDLKLAEWAEGCAHWTIKNVVERLLPTGMIPGG